MADSKHHVAGVIATLGLAPLVELFGEVGGRLAGKRRVGGAEPLTFFAVAGRASHEPARGIAFMVKPQPRSGHDRACLERQRGIISGDGFALSIKLLRDPAHLGVLAAPVRIGFQLSLQITSVQGGQPWCGRAVTATVEPVARKAGAACTGSRAAHRNDPPALREPVKRGRLGLGAARHQGRCGKRNDIAHGVATARSGCWFRMGPVTPLLLLAAACKPPPEQRQLMPGADANHGKAVIERVGCGSCHSVPGIQWPQGMVGPSLNGIAEQALIAGKLPNRPDVLAAYVRNAPALVPGSGMPAMPVSEADSHDIAAYLYEQGAR